MTINNMKTYVITSAIIKHNNKFLIGKRASTKKVSPNQWEFISGFIDSKESAEDIILRELMEEINLKGKIIKSAEPYVIVDNNERWIIIPFLIEVETNKVNRNDKDHSELLWVNREELSKNSDLLQDVKELSNREFFK